MESLEPGKQLTHNSTCASETAVYSATIAVCQDWQKVPKGCHSIDCLGNYLLIFFNLDYDHKRNTFIRRKKKNLANEKLMITGSHHLLQFVCKDIVRCLLGKVRGLSMSLQMLRRKNNGVHKKSQVKSKKLGIWHFQLMHL